MKIIVLKSDRKHTAMAALSGRHITQFIKHLENRLRLGMFGSTLISQLVSPRVSDRYMERKNYYLTSVSSSMLERKRQMTQIRLLMAGDNDRPILTLLFCYYHDLIAGGGSRKISLQGSAWLSTMKFHGQKIFQLRSRFCRKLRPGHKGDRICIYLSHWVSNCEMGVNRYDAGILIVVFPFFYGSHNEYYDLAWLMHVHPLFEEGLMQFSPFKCR